MATGYTHAVIDKPDMTFPTFALRCARAFGVLMDMRDDPMDAAIPETIEPQRYHLDSLQAARAKRHALQTMSIDEAERRAADDYENAVRAKAECVAKYAAENARFNEMLAQVESWTPPSKDHEGLKRFMLEQLRGSIHTHVPNDPPHKMTGATWLSHAIENVEEDVRYSLKHWELAQKQAREATQWLKDLRASLQRQ